MDEIKCPLCRKPLVEWEYFSKFSFKCPTHYDSPFKAHYVKYLISNPIDGNVHMEYAYVGAHYIYNKYFLNCPDSKSWIYKITSPNSSQHLLCLDQAIELFPEEELSKKIETILNFA